MSKKIILKDSNHHIEWLEKSIIDEHINYYEYSDFKNIQSIGRGSYGIVNRANWKNVDHFFALKTFNNDKQTLEGIIKELKLHRSVDVHENIIRLCGITKAETGEIQKYSLVLEYADSGTLNTYLDKHFNKLDWNDKFHLSSQLTSAVEFLHDNDIIHRDLHGNNILIHQKNIKLGDFGLSKKIIETSSNLSKLLGVLPYVDPKSFDERENYKLNKKSDVFSIGVLLWQISSGYRPFHDVDYGPCLMLSIINGRREKIIIGTPVRYSKLYTECWRYEPDERPDMREVVLTLKATISPEIIICDSHDERKSSFSLEKYKPNLESSEITTNINSDSSINNKLILNTKSNLNVMSNLNTMSSLNTISIPNTSVSEIAYLNVDNIFESRRSSRNHLDSSSIASDRASLSSINLIESIYGAVADKLISYIIKKHDRGITFDQVQQLISKKILQLNQNVNDLIDWLSKNQDKSQYIWFLGLFYYNNIVIKENNSVKAFELFLKAANNNYSIAQIYLAKCYYDGYGINCNKKIAFDWCKRAVNNGSIIGKFYLGYCYEFGIGIVNNEKESAYWYNEASRCGNTTAKLYLANCYRLGKGVDKDEIKAFKYYETLAKQEISDAQLELGNCFYNGIGTKVDKIQAKHWYEKAANKGNIIAKNVLKKYYNKKTGIETENTKKTKPYKTLFYKNLSQLGLYYIGKILLKANYEKSFYYLRKAARDGCKYSQFNLGKCYQLGTGVRKDTREAYELYKKSAKQESISAQFQLIYCYIFGYGTEINRVKAFELTKIMSKKGDNDATYLLALHYTFGVGINTDRKKAFEIFKKLAKNEDQDTKYTKYLSGDKEIIINKVDNFYSRILTENKHLNSNILLSYFYIYGLGTEINVNKAFELFKKVEKSGNTIAQFFLRNLYTENSNKSKAFESIKKSANKVQIGKSYPKRIGIEVNERKAFELYKEAARKGYDLAKCDLADCYQNGKGVGKDERKAIKLYEEAAEKGYDWAKFKLAECYQNGKGLEKDEGKAFKLYEEIAEDGYSWVCNKLGYCYQNGIGIEKDEKKAVELYKKASKAEKGDSWSYVNLNYKKIISQEYLNAQFRLAYCYDKGIGIEIDKIKAFELYNIAAEKEHETAQNNLGCLYMKGEVPEKDSKKAIYWFQRGASNGNKIAHDNLAICYELGIGTNKDKPKAFELYEASAEKGYVNAKFHLGYCYVNGIGTQVNKKKGFEIYRKVTEKENINEINILESSYKNIDEIAKDINEVYYWYQKSAECNNGFALYKLGEIYELGKGVNKNEVRAFDYYKQAAERGCINGKYKIGNYFFNGIIVDINKEMAYNLYKEAAEGGNCDAKKYLALFHNK
ncbi:hypothetical protein RclHR1_16560006 [Rhizophagus clarus]|uniref:Kinase-like domain-containing protein n=1 Tax=Rhizophagus clarus TaxID=94130 RepID=A0A2Z6QJB0_9GLOM|nr:hypothetical protein RclHR1_16560006 [Rhizophagus clarus]GES98844.1 kinase-like domain-containing protein [Rhizophagus clarus]